jgi:hypothetical protein
MSAVTNQSGCAVLTASDSRRPAAERSRSHRRSTAFTNPAARGTPTARVTSTAVATTACSGVPPCSSWNSASNSTARTGPGCCAQGRCSSGLSRARSCQYQRIVP